MILQKHCDMHTCLNCSILASRLRASYFRCLKSFRDVRQTCIEYVDPTLSCCIITRLFQVKAGAKALLEFGTYNQMRLNSIMEECVESGDTST